jgi:WhiB family redox-sensing transcriptional regulator
MRELWQDDALCAQTDPDAFFPTKGGSVQEALSICAACTVRQQCLDYAQENRYYDGIYGGLSPLARKKLQRRAA